MMKKYKVNSIEQLKTLISSRSMFLDIDSYLKHNVYGIYHCYIFTEGKHILGWCHRECSICDKDCARKNDKLYSFRKEKLERLMR